MFFYGYGYYEKLFWKDGVCILFFVVGGGGAFIGRSGVLCKSFYVEFITRKVCLFF